MKRREVLKYTALITGAAISAPLMTSLLSGCKPEEVENAVKYTPQFFTEKEFSVVKNLVDIILPKTDSPSASEVGVHRMIDHMIGKVYKKEDQTSFKQGFTALINHLTNTPAEGKADLDQLVKLDANKKLALLKNLDNSDDELLKAVRDTYLDFKQQTVAYYLSTEEIGKNYLNYLPVPGKYEACISLEAAGGKAWAL